MAAVVREKGQPFEVEEVEFVRYSREAEHCAETSRRLEREELAPSAPPAVPKELGRFLAELPRAAEEVTARVATVSPDVASSTNLGGWINKAGIWSIEERTDWFADDPETRLWRIEREVREQGLPPEFLQSVAFMTRFATEVVSLESQPDGVTARVRRPDGEHEVLEAAYAITADGPRSRTRESLGIGVDSPGTLGSQFEIYFHADLSRWVADNPNALYWLYNPDAQGVVISLDGDRRWHLLFAYDPDRESVEDFPPERCESIVRELIGDEDVEIDIRSVLPWRMRAAIARQFHSNRVFLAGDAAYTMPPTGGMGMNTGIGDVHNLVWKLHAVLRGTAGPGLLDTYEAERIPVGHRNTDNSVRNARSMAETGLAGILVSDPEGFAVIEQPVGRPLRERLGAAVPGQMAHFSFDGLSFGYCCDSAAVVPDGTPAVPSGVHEYRPTARPGARAPHYWLERDGDEVSTIDFSDGRLVLLAAGGSWVDAARDVSVELAIELVAYVVGRDENAGLRDTVGGWAEACGVGPDGAVLIRPDGHVAWRSADAVEDARDKLNDARSPRFYIGKPDDFDRMPHASHRRNVKPPLVCLYRRMRASCPEDHG